MKKAAPAEETKRKSRPVKQKPLRVLIVEDNEGDALLLVRELKKSGYNPEFRRVETAAAMNKALKDGQWDIVLCDYALPKFNAPQAIRLLRETNMDIPIIIVSGVIAEETAADCMILGAHDFIRKDNWSRLYPAIKRELGEAKTRKRQKQAEEALRRSQNFLAGVFDSIQDGISILDTKMNIIGVNSAHEKWYKHNAPLVGKKCYQAYHGRNKPCKTCPSQKTLKTSKPAFEIVPKEGPKGKIEGWLEIYSFPLLDGGTKKINGVIEYVRDITERIKAEQELQKEKNFSQTLVQHSAVFFVAIDQEGKTIMMNDTLLATLGYTKEEVTGKDYLKTFVPETDRKALAKVFQRLTKAKKPSINENLILTKKGEEILVEWHGQPAFNQDGELDYFFDVGINITDRKQAQDALKESEQKYRTILASIREGYFEVDVPGNYTFANEANCKLLGYTMDELIGMNHRQHMDKEAAQKLLKPYTELYRTGKPIDSLEVESYKKDGTKVIYETSVSLMRDPQGKPIGFRGVSRDITGRKQAQEELQKLALIVKNSSELINLASPDGSMIFLNEAGSKMLGIPPLDATRHNIMDVIPEDWRGLVQNELLPAVTERGKWEGNLQYRNIQTNALTDVHAMAFLIKDAKTGAPLFLANISLDITERKRAEEALKASEEKHRTILKTIEDGYYEADLGGNLTFFNDSTCRISGYGPEESMGMNFRQYTPENEADKIYSNFHEVYETEIPVKGLRYEIIRKDKEIRYVEASISLRKDSAGKKIGFQGILRDITERRQAEQYLQMVKYCMDEAADAVFWMDKEGRYTYVNEEACRSLGYTREELLGMSLWDIDPVYPKKQWSENWKKYEKDGYGLLHIETWHRRKDGLIFPVEVLAKNFRIGDTQLHTAFVRDITERKHAEKTLQASEEKYRNILETMEEGYYEVDLAGNTTFINDAMCRIQGYSKKELLAMSNRQYTDPETAKKVYQEYNEVYRTEKPGKASEHEMISKDGSRIWIEASIDLRRDSAGKKIGFKGIVRDITERKLSEKAIQESEQRYRSIVENINDAIYIHDFNGNIIDVNENACKMLGYTRDELIGSNLAIIDSKENIEHLPRRMDVLLKENSILFEGKHVRKDGSIVPAEISAKVVTREGNGLIQGFVRDITERKRAEEELRSKHEELETMIESSPIMIFFKDTQNRFTRVNKALLEATALAKEEIEGKSDEEINPLRAAVNKAEDQEIITTGLPKVGILETVKTRKGIKVLRTAKAPYKDAQGNIIGIVGFSVDITEQKKAQDALRESEEKYRSLVESAQEGIYQSTADGHYITVNQAFARMLGYSSPQEIMQSVTDISHQLYVHPSDRERLIKRVNKYGEISDFETEFYRKDGSRVWLSVSMHAVKDSQGNFLYYQGMVQDFTEKKKMAAERQENLKKLRKALGATINAMAVTVETRDPYTAGHQQRVADLARAIATEMRLSSEKIDGVRMASMIHDIGKISIPSEILTKPTQLTALEFNLIKTHPASGHAILKDIEFPWPIARIVLEHHERIDGSGYPFGLKGDQILLESKILAVADVVEAISSHRPYRAAQGIETGLEELEKNKGILYDEEAANVCLRLFREKHYTLAA